MAPLLTFDDGPAPDTERLLDILAEHDCRAVFFLLGKQVAARAQLVRRMSAEGHTLGNHTWDHPDLRQLSLSAVREQLRRTSEVIETAAGVAPRYFRPPFGYSNAAIDALAGGLGLSKMMWTVGTDDWRDPGVPAIAASICGAPANAVVLLHDGPRRRGQTVQAVAEALAAGRAENTLDPSKRPASRQEIPHL
ncbi:MAG TPA: polysaccharide deacetylase family protein [Solirubrobacteraceae bacterium]|jgi:peptidoglycan/xylan/chitin deacetylase (PgdA/CDA1 family)|nr:polysaccharide deacetylase family protein [Solirubrobacteraceae bacterium]